YAAELARVTLWIGDLQWSLKNGFRNWPRPILSTLDQIENRDALLNPDGTEAQWPVVDAIVGNPPFKGGSKLKKEIDPSKLERLREIFGDLVRGDGDFYNYWFEKASASISNRSAHKAGLICKNTIQQQSNRSTIQRIDENHSIFSVWTRVPWMNEGAAVEVHFICFGDAHQTPRLNGQEVEGINWRLEASDVDPFRGGVPKKLKQNKNSCFNGVKRNGPFDIDREQAAEWLRLPSNPNGRPNADVLVPYMNGDDLTGRPRGRWLIDFGKGRTLHDVAMYEAPFAYAEAEVLPQRAANPDKKLSSVWCQFEGLRDGLRERLPAVPRYLALSEKSHQYVWRPIDARILPDNRLIAVVSDSDVMFGILQSRYQELWMEKTGALLESRRCYTPSTTFETFPFPEGLTPDIPAADYADDPRAIAIAQAARELNQLRENWLNPPDLVRIEPEVVPGYPDRVLPRDEAAAKVLKTRTLTNLYNQRPAWLDMAHRRLDAAVAAAYGLPADLTDDEILERLFALNQERAKAGR
ncbi:MAG: class I SAM-dependent DNA methyltransferase, partial [Brevundimonas sp.]|nr:class I SAM-dependent DNA methyltransferase [Brevundimonas sp.]